MCYENSNAFDEILTSLPASKFFANVNCKGKMMCHGNMHVQQVTMNKLTGISVHATHLLFKS